MALVEPEQHGQRRAELSRPGAADLLGLGWHIPPATHQDTPAILVLATILGGWRGFLPYLAGDWQPRSNRLYRALVDTKLATDVGVRHEMKIDPSLLIANATLAGGASLDRVEAVVEREVAALQKNSPPKGELDRAKQQVRAWSRYEQDGVTYQGMLLSVSEGLTSWDFTEELFAKAFRVRPEQVREAARRYLVDEHLSVVRFHHEEVPV
jgi:zinc protease